MLRLTEYTLVCATQSKAMGVIWADWVRQIATEGLHPLEPVRALAGLLRCADKCPALLSMGSCHGAECLGAHLQNACMVIFALQRTIQIPCTHLDRVLGGRYLRTSIPPTTTGGYHWFQSKETGYRMAFGSDGSIIGWQTPSGDSTLLLPVGCQPKPVFLRCQQSPCPERQGI